LQHLGVEADFASMAAFERQHEATAAVARLEATNAEQLELVVPGSTADQLLRLGLDT
jgi:hypothetical protein